jgi:flagellar biosynthetic protein FliO
VTDTPSRKTLAARATAVACALWLATPSPAPAEATVAEPSAVAPVPSAATAADVEKQLIPRKKAPGATTNPTTQRTGAAAAAARSPGNAGGLDVQRLVTALGIVLGLILLARWVLRRFFGVAGATRATRAVQVLARSPLSPKQQLMLLRVGRRVIVVGDAGGQLNTLSEITDPDEVASLIGQVQDDHTGRASKSFGNLFGRMQGKFDDEAAGAEAEPAATGQSREEGVDQRDGDGTVDGDPAVDSTRQELSGLMDRVRMLSRQFKNT